MAIVLVQSRQIESSGSVTFQDLAFSSDVTAASLLLCASRSSGGTSQPTSVTDSRSQTWTIDKKQANTTDNGTVAIASCPNAQAGATTPRVNQASGSCRMIIAEYSGMDTSSVLDQTNGGQADSVTHKSSGNITTTVNNELIVGISGNSNTGTWTATSGFTIVQASPAAPSSRLVMEDKIVTSTGTYASDPDDGSSNNKMTLIASYKAPSTAASVGAGLTQSVLLRRRSLVK